MNETSLQKRTLALAGIFQAAALVKQLAETGRVTERYFTPCIESLFKIDANDVVDVYSGHIKNITLGLQELCALFTHNKLPKDSNIARYVLSLLHLEKKLNNNSKMNELIRTGILRAKIQATYYAPTHENIMSNLSSLYTDTLSTFSFRIHISGQPVYLNQPNVVNKARALLLAGIRSAVLWRQVGGKRWQLLISRNSMIATAKSFILKATAEEAKEVTTV
jgi:high frequency lysogenization protein